MDIVACKFLLPLYKKNGKNYTVAHKHSVPMIWIKEH